MEWSLGTAERANVTRSRCRPHDVRQQALGVTSLLMPRQIANLGDVFWITLTDGSKALGQIVEINKEVLNSITCAFFDERNEVPKDLSNPFSIQFVTKDLFTNGTWRRVSNRTVQVSKSLLPYRETMKDGWIGAEIIGSGNINTFISAFYGLRDWNEMYDDDYYQKLLLAGFQRYENT